MKKGKTKTVKIKGKIKSKGKNRGKALIKSNVKRDMKLKDVQAKNLEEAAVEA